jgi:uncharacterized protein (DUF488 family)
MEKPVPSDQWPAGTIFTVGHSTLPIERFVQLLKTYDIECLLDIRTVPKSRHNPQFNGDELRKSLAVADIGYRALPSLGGLRHARKDSSNTGWRNKSFRGYADHMQTPEFQEGLHDLIETGSRARVAIMCAEAVPWRCHRSLVADALNARGIPVAEILSESAHRMHKLTAFAHVEGDRISYPPEQGTLL